MISVIIPAYNRVRFLEEAIPSVLGQSHFRKRLFPGRFELLVVDDGSTDGTEALVKSFGNCVSYKYQKHKGVSTARNVGLRLAQGNFIAFLDSDDLWMEDKIAIQMNYMKSFPKAVICCTEEKWIRRGVFVNPQTKHRKYSGWIFDKVLPLCLLSLSSALFRRDVFDEVGLFDEDLPACEDYDMGIRVAHRYPVHLITKSLILKRGGHPDQLSRKYWGMDRFRIAALEKALKLDLTPEQERRVKQEIARKGLILIKGFQKRGKPEEAEKYRELVERYRKEKK